MRLPCFLKDVIGKAPDFPKVIQNTLNNLPSEIRLRAFGFYKELITQRQLNELVTLVKQTLPCLSNIINT
jgi:hypothetical protein